jgi:uncharacterized protein (DUF2236 family)
MTAFALPRPILKRLDGAALELMTPPGVAFDFTTPEGELALAPADGVSWRVFANPVALFVGGVAAVILELAEPRVRAGVWDHSSFRRDPKGRLQRTGLAAMISVYGARSRAEEMIAHVRRMHDKVQGFTEHGEAYRANDQALLDWVHGTAAFGFLEAYHAYVRPVSPADRARYWSEGKASSVLYGALGAPASQAAFDIQLEAMRGRLDGSPAVLEFLELMRRTPILPPPLRPLQDLLVRAAVQITPGWVRTVLNLDDHWSLSAWERALIRRGGRLADGLVLPSSPAAQSRRRVENSIAP